MKNLGRVCSSLESNIEYSFLTNMLTVNIPVTLPWLKVAKIQAMPLANSHCLQRRNGLLAATFPRQCWSETHSIWKLHLIMGSYFTAVSLKPALLGLGSKYFPQESCIVYCDMAERVEEVMLVTPLD